MTANHDDENEPVIEPAAMLWILRSSMLFPLGMFFFAMPLMDADTHKPWYFWVGSGVVAFMLGAVLCYVGVKRGE